LSYTSESRRQPSQADQLHAEASSSREVSKVEYALDATVGVHR